MLLDEIAEALGFDVSSSALPATAAAVGLGPPWKSSTGWCVAAVAVAADEPGVKPRDFHRYCTRLLALGELSDRERAFVLQVGSRTSEIEWMAARRWGGQLRVISPAHLLMLARLKKIGILGHDDIVRMLRPPDPAIDPFVQLIDRCVSAVEDGAGGQTGDDACWLARIEYEDHTAVTRMLSSVVGQRRLLPLSDSGSVPACIAVGDWVCLYVVGRGVVGHARVASTPEKPLIRLVRDAERYPWICRLATPVLYLENPVCQLPSDAASNAAANDERLLTSVALTRLRRREFQRLIREIPEPAAHSFSTQQRAI